MLKKFTVFESLCIIGVLVFPFILVGCDKKEVKDLIRNKHAESYIFVQRVNNPDPSKRPSPQEMTAFINAAAKDYESMDIYINNWKPDPTMSAVDMNGNQVKKFKR